MAKGGGSYAVGYKKPPRATQFRRGQSGNPKGRPKGSKNLASIIQKELASHVDVTENGSRKTISKQAAIAKQLVNNAARGDPKALAILLRAAGSGEPEAEPPPPQQLLDERVDKLVIASIVQRIRQMSDPPPPPVSESAVPSPQPS